MPRLRALLAAFALGIGIGAYLALSVGWPTFVSVGVGALVTLIVLLIGAALDVDPREADAAWRAAAPDLVRRRLGPGSENDDPDGGADA